MSLSAGATIDGTTWAALALVLTCLGAALSWLAWRRRGLAAGLRGLAWSLLPVAAWLTGTLRLAANIVGDVVAWGARLVFSPLVWLGVLVAGTAVLLWVVSGLMHARGIGVRRQEQDASRSTGDGPTANALTRPARKKPSRSKARTDDDLEDLDDIEAILKRHGI